MSKRVALTIGSELHKAQPYVDALEAAGLEVRVLSAQQCLPDFVSEEAAAAAALDGVDGLVLAGGGDIDPVLLDKPELHPTIDFVERERDVFERAVFSRAWDSDMPVLAICRGMQVMNWVLGGTLHTDIDSFVEPCDQPKMHRQTEYGQERHEIGHPIIIREGTRLFDIMGVSEIGVNTIHHQALEQLAEPLVVTAVAPDGIIEAVEAPSKQWVLGVQFHPEAMFKHHPDFLKLFKAFAAHLEGV